MAKTKKNKGTAILLVIVLIIFVLVAVFFIAGSRSGDIDEQPVSRDKKYVDLRGAEEVDVSAILEYENPETIDLRESTAGVGDYEAIKEAFPNCEILWDVPLGGSWYAPETESLTLASLDMEDLEGLKYLTGLKELDLREAEASPGMVERIQSIHPRCHILWTVRVCEGFAVENEAETVVLSDEFQVEPLAAAAGLLGNIKEIRLDYSPFSKEDYAALCAAFPEAAVEFSVTIGGQEIPPETEKLDFSGFSYEEAVAAAEVMGVLPNLQEVELMDASGKSPFSLDEVIEIQKLCPDVKLNYSFELFGQKVSTSTQRLEYYNAEIGDKGLDTFRKVIPIMHGLEYLRFDSCGTSDEAVAQLRDEFPEVKIVWLVKIGVISIYTDTLRLWVNDGFFKSELWKLKYCTEVRYIDFGHQMAVIDLEWARYMPDLEVCIVAMTSITDISPLAECKKLEFLEIFTNDVSDLSPLAELENLEYLNIGNMPITDISPIFGLNKLKIVNCNMCQSLSQEQIDEFKALHPDTKFNYVWFINPKGTGWNFDDNGNPTERYQLLRRQIGYDGSASPPGYLTVPIE